MRALCALQRAACASSQVWCAHGAQENFIGLLQALGRGDGTRAAECMLRFSGLSLCELLGLSAQMPAPLGVAHLMAD